VVLASPTAEQREAAGRLSGRTSFREASLSLSLEELEATLRAAGISGSLAEAVEVLRGPLRADASTRAHEEREWAALFSSAEVSVSGHPRLATWLARLRETGLLSRLAARNLARGRSLLEPALALARRLPERGTPLPELAAELVGDAHALDVGAPLTAVAISLLCALTGATSPRDALERRDLWASVGVACDELSAPVLTLNLVLDDGGLLARATRLHGDAGEPYRISLRQLLRSHLGTPRTPVVFVCENPSVVAAAARRLGPRSRPVVCIEGKPRTASRVLLDGLSRANVELRYHGDFDWPGLEIANLLVARHGVVPWRMGAGDYHVAPKGRRLEGTPVPAVWDSRLTAEMSSDGRAVHEEQVLSALLDDLDDLDATRLS
jgi:uncharacterized protein (TIGR02679 family)